jgi:hypothetical protein
MDIINNITNYCDGEKMLDILTILNSKIDTIMTKQERFDAILARMDVVTTDIAGDFKAFVEEYKEGTVSEESLAKAEANITTLEELAKSKENPIPGETTPPVTDSNTGSDTNV